MNRRFIGFALVTIAAAGVGALLLELRDTRRMRKRQGWYLGVRP